MDEVKLDYKKIFIKRKRQFQHESINSEVMAQQLSYTKRGLGGYFSSKSSTRSGSGLTREEEIILLPLILEIPVTDPEFWKRVDKFYTEINTHVPFGAVGLELQVGQMKKFIMPIELDPKTNLPKRTADGSLIIKQAITPDNMPISVDDYIKFRHALKHPYCGGTPQEAEGNSLIQYYVEDPDAVLDSRVKQLDIEDLALVDYAQVKLDGKKTKMVVSIMKNYLKPKPGVPKIDPLTAKKEDLLLALKELAVNQPSRFHDVVSDQNLSRRYFIDSLLTAGILTRINNTIVDKDTNAPLGNNINEVIIKIYDGKNTAQYNSYKQRLADSSNKVVLIEE